MSERDKGFNSSEWVQTRIFYFEAEQAWQESQQKAKEKQADINFKENINPRAAKANKELEQIELERKARKLRLIEESNRGDSPTLRGLEEMHKMMQKRYATGWSVALDNAEISHNSTYRPGWGPWRMQTRGQIQPFLDRLHEKRRNAELDLAEETDRQKYPDLYE